MSATVQCWTDVSPVPLAMDSIRELHVPPSNYRISPARYEPGIKFQGMSMAGRLYVLSGACSMAVGPWHVELKADMFADFPEGHFEFEVLGDENVQLVNVWLLPESLRIEARSKRS